MQITVLAVAFTMAAESHPPITKSKTTVQDKPTE
jgi:hypothetical protein